MVLSTLRYFSVLSQFTLRYLVSGIAFILLSSCATVTEEVIIPGRGVTELSDEQTPAGINYSLAFMPDAERVSLHVVWPNRWVHENNKAVAASLGVDLLSSGGGGDRTAKQITKKITSLDSAASLEATPDHVYGTFTAPPEALEETVSIIRDIIVEPELSESGFDALKDSLTERVASRQQQASARLWSVTRHALLGDSSLTEYWNNTPVERVVTAVTLNDIRQWRENTFVREGATVAIAGNITPDSAAGFIDQLFADLPSKANTDTSDPLQFDVKTGFTLLLHDEQATNTLIAVIGLLPPSSDGDEVADIVAVGALGQGKDSRLGQARQTELPDAPPVNASIANFNRQIRVFGMNAVVPNDTAIDTFALIKKTYNNFKLADLNDQDVLRAAVPFANSVRNNGSRVDRIVYGLGQLILDDLPRGQLLTVTQDALSLRADDINQRILDRYPDWDSLIKVVMTSDDELVVADCVIESVDELVGCDF